MPLPHGGRETLEVIARAFGSRGCCGFGYQFTSAGRATHSFRRQTKCINILCLPLNKNMETKLHVLAVFQEKYFESMKTLFCLRFTAQITGFRLEQ